eukprot:TRINITY_DN5886_c0_g1_i1.p1 TRINITY_DN5886_c0_g1~~TRINITY_DN5886_c0_g1_i1.p1  ORF type:complete len:591 (+),score=253.83 TRINITY_DN5886_c0_g1_i1:46-1773(+)
MKCHSTWAEACLAAVLLSVSLWVPPAASASATVYGAVLRAQDDGPSRSTRGSDFTQVLTSDSPFNASILAQAAAYGWFRDAIDTDGWSYLEVRTNASFAQPDQAYAAGRLEGVLTQQRAYEFMNNVYGLKSGFPKELKEFVRANLAWMDQQLALNPTDVVWLHIGLSLQQQAGMWDGYNATAPAKYQLDFDTFYAGALMGDLNDLCVKFPGCASSLSTRGHCSAIIKPVLDENGTYVELFAGHTTWSNYETMTRIFKHYDFPWLDANGNTVPGRHVSFSSYPTMPCSSDDWYTLAPSQLAVLETTIENNNANLWDDVRPESVPYWIRNGVANRLANTATEWHTYFSSYNSGTYNNEWMVVDYKLFKPSTSSSLPANLLVVGEQLPGVYVLADLTASYLEGAGYWASYNRPAYGVWPLMYNISGQWPLYDKYGDHYSWYKTARAVIFAREHSSVVDGDTYGKLIRYNRFETDPIGTQGCSGGGRSGSNAISERGDLTAKKSGCIGDIAHIDEGGIDAKFTSAAMMATGTLATRIQSGPTYDDQPVFDWSGCEPQCSPHIGLPKHWQFGWLNVSWVL